MGWITGWMSRWRRRVSYWIGRSRAERELDDEMRFHIEMEARSLVEQGVEPAEARRRAAVAFGGVDRFREQVRDARGARWLDDLVRDGAFALRTLARAPAFTASALLVLVLGIGAVTAAFGVVHAVLLRPLPYPEPDRLVRVWQALPDRGAFRTVFSAPDLRDWAERSDRLTHLAGYSTLPAPLVLMGDGPAEEIPTAYVVGDFFGVMGTPALIGRTLRPDEYESASRVVVLSHGYWQRRFGGDVAVVGRTLTLDHQPYQVVGVMPPGFAAPSPQVDAWTHLSVVPQRSIPHEERFVRFLQGVGRLAPDASLEQTRDDLSAVALALSEAYPDSNGDRTAATVEPLRDVLVGDVRAALWIVLGAVGLLQLLASAIVAGLLLARASERRAELAVRVSLGAGRGRVVRQLVTESLALGLAGGLGGLLVAWWGTAFVSRYGADLLPRSAEVGLDGGIVAFALAATLLTTLLFGVLPAARMAEGGIAAALGRGGGRSGGRSGTAGPGGMRLRRGLVGAEVAVAVVLTVGAILLARSLERLQRVELGFEPEGATALVLTISQEKYPTRAEYMPFYRELLRRAAALPGVEAVGSVRNLPTRGGGEQVPFTVPGVYEPGPGDDPNVELVHIGGAAFAALGTEVTAGRAFDARDGADAPGRVVVNEAFVRAYLGGEAPIGRTVRLGGEYVQEIIGVVEDIRHHAPETPAEPTVYVHQEQNARIGLALVVRAAAGEGALDGEGLTGALREVVTGLDPDQPVSELLPMASALSDALARPRTLTVLVGTFAALAALLAALGVYGIIATLVRSRMREIGLRMALGADALDVVRWVLRAGMPPALVGLGVGLFGAGLLTGVLEGVLFGVEPLDAIAFAAAATALAGLAAAACLVPAIRATRLQPMAVLKDE